MARDILSEFGPESSHKEAPRATKGGETSAKELRYDPPKGPSSQMESGPGIHGTNHGNCGTQGRH